MRKINRFIFDPGSAEPFRLSRSKIELFINCPRCFYLDCRLGVKQPPGYPFTLNSAVDKLLKKEFDHYRENDSAHPLILSQGIDAIPFKHEKLEEWRDALHRGIRFHHQASNFLLTGGIDDIWINSKGELIVVDYKATAKKGQVSLDADWQIGYKRQISFYAWLFKQNGFQISPISYFVYCNGKTDRKGFNSQLDFDITILPYEIDFSWVEGALIEARKCLEAESLPNASESCRYCKYTNDISNITRNRYI